MVTGIDPFSTGLSLFLAQAEIAGIMDAVELGKDPLAVSGGS